ncbi:MAG: two-component system response regulator [Desulfovibrionaceae bacterium]
MNRKKRILVVDDTPDNIFLLREILSPEYTVLAASNGADALEVAGADPPPDCILLDVLMPEMDGYEVCRRLKARESTRRIPVLFVTTLGEEQDEAHGLELGAVDYIQKPVRPAVVRARVDNHLRLKAYQDDLEAQVQRRTWEVVRTQDTALMSLAALAESRDNELSGHFRRTQRVARMIAREIASRPEHADFFRAITIDILYKSIPLHDVGKVAIPDHILLKPGRLTPEEFEIMKEHAVRGRDILARAERNLGQDSFLRLAREIAYTHHERWDGAGYPQGLAGTAIPLAGRIMAVVDVYDALISQRVYKAPMPHRDALEIIREGRGAHFDPSLTDVLLALEDQVREVSLAHADTESERRALAPAGAALDV